MSIDGQNTRYNAIGMSSNIDCFPPYYLHISTDPGIPLVLQALARDSSYSCRRARRSL